ncbi:aldehyde dehydrogenase, partial [Paraburkholderia sp. Se-20369]|nr:aldehyde dehydrogenase [Paraburkholderia sp. Se-20369]
MNDSARFSMTIGGQAAPTLARFAVIDPATDRAIADAPDATPAQLDEAV